jgi:hypothetical protein
MPQIQLLTLVGLTCHWFGSCWLYEFHGALLAHDSPNNLNLMLLLEP